MDAHADLLSEWKAERAFARTESRGVVGFEGLMLGAQASSWA
jgi:hypothetical protein